MGYQFKLQESLASGVRRIAGEQLSQAIQVLQDPEQNRHYAIHEVRKRFKKLRGLVRLVRSGLGDEYTAINVWYRDVGRRLSRIRDAESLLESLQALQERFPDSAYTELFAEFEKRFHERKQKVVEEWTDLDQELEQLSAELQQAKQRVENWKIKGAATKILKADLRRTYERGTVALAQLHQSPNDELFHECRKRSKYHLYHIRLLNNVWPAILSAREAELDELNDYLGDDHDLAVMTQVITGKPEAFGTSADVEQLLTLIRQQRNELQTAGLKLADRIFAEKSKAFAHRIKNYWKLWKKDRTS
ncbi:CHAD domain-containing protein [Gimesia sp.]|uniref:CHAD domain-containing protein n=1 Tax=Gimesia sp. TaxID=2024833 RepID=UPI003A92303D